MGDETEGGSEGRDAKYRSGGNAVHTRGDLPRFWVIQCWLTEPVRQRDALVMMSSVSATMPATNVTVSPIESIGAFSVAYDEFTFRRGHDALGHAGRF